MNILLKTYFFITVCTLTVLTSCKHESELAPGTPEVCFETQILPVLQSNCTMSGCHDGTNDLPLLKTYDEIRKLVEPLKPVQSKLHKVITANRLLDIAMPPKPYDQLSSEQINQINIWILQGANNTSCAQECDTTTVTFNDNVLPITNTYCKGCHSGNNPSGGIYLTDYNSIKASIETGRFVGSIEQLLGFSAMPQGGAKLSDCHIYQIKKWIKNGMPKN